MTGPAGCARRALCRALCRTVTARFPPALPQLWDLRVRDAVKVVPSRYQLTSVAMSESAERLYFGGIDNEIRVRRACGAAGAPAPLTREPRQVWDVRKDAELYRLAGHADTITGLSLSPDGNHLLSNGMDNALLCWDVRPFVAGHRCVKTFRGAAHSFEKNLLRCAWAPNGSRVSCGSADRFVYVWDFADCRLLYRLPGHQGSVNQVRRRSAAAAGAAALTRGLLAPAGGLPPERAHHRLGQLRQVRLPRRDRRGIGCGRGLVSPPPDCYCDCVPPLDAAIASCSRPCSSPLRSRASVSEHPPMNLPPMKTSARRGVTSGGASRCGCRTYAAQSTGP